MIKIELLVVGRMKQTAYKDLCATYLKRMSWSITITEIESKKPPHLQQDDECEKLLARLDPDAFVVALDERGKSLNSIDFAKKIQTVAIDQGLPIQCIIGGADGLTFSLRQKTHLLMSFGTQTWPHMMVRVMLLEQLYRAQQILAGHPYHRG